MRNDEQREAVHDTDGVHIGEYHSKECTWCGAALTPDMKRVKLREQVYQYYEQPNPTNSTDKIDEVLEEMFFDAIIDKFKHRILNENDIKKVAKAKLVTIMDEVREDELRRVNKWTLNFSLSKASLNKWQQYFSDRLAQLTKDKA